MSASNPSSDLGERGQVTEEMVAAATGAMVIHRHPSVGAAPKGGEGKYAVYFYDRTSPFNCVPLAIVDGFHHVATAADRIPRLQAEAVLAAALPLSPLSRRVEELERLARNAVRTGPKTDDLELLRRALLKDGGNGS